MNDEQDRKPTTKLPATRPGSAPTLVARPVPPPAAPPRPARPADANARLKEAHRQGTTLEELRARQSNHEFDVKQTFEAVGRRDEGLVARLGDLGNNDKIQNVALLILARELGAEHKLPPALQNSLPPPAGGPSEPPAMPVLGRLEARGKRSQLLLYAGLAVGLLEAVDHILSFFQP